MNMTEICDWLEASGFTFAVCHPDLGCRQGGEPRQMAMLAGELICKVTAETGELIEIKSVIEVCDG